MENKTNKKGSPEGSARGISKSVCFLIDTKKKEDPIKSDPRKPNTKTIQPKEESLKEAVSLSRKTGKSF